MEKMRFHWEKDGKKGSFKVESFTVEDCMRVAESEIQKFGAEMVDWYSI
jgi:hypothetical protein